MKRNLAIAMCLLVCFFFTGIDAHAVTINFGSESLGPSNPLVIDGITVTPWSEGLPETVAGKGLGNNYVGRPGYVDRVDNYGPGPVEGPHWAEGVNIKANGWINSITIRPYFSVLEGEYAKLPFEIGYWGHADGGPNWVMVDPADPSVTLSIPIPGEPATDEVLLMVASNWGEWFNFQGYLEGQGWPAVTFQYGFTVGSLDYTPYTVPEAGTMFLLCTGLIGIAGYRRRFINH